MLEPPPLREEAIRSCLRTSFGLSVTAIDFLPIGNDSNSWVYRVEAADGTAYFLKAKQGAIYLPSLAVPHALKEQGIEQIVAPLPTVAGELSGEVGGFALILYPFLAAETGMRLGLSDRQWTELGAVLKRVHASQLPPDVVAGLQPEDFSASPHSRSVLAEALALIVGRDFAGESERAMAGLLASRSGEIRALVDRAQELGRVLRAETGERVLCHGDIHTNNVLIDGAGGLFIVDWDLPILAPKERDLMFVVGGPVGSLAVGAREEHLFFAGYGARTIDPVALAYYRYDWAVQDVADYARRVFLMPDVGEGTRQGAVQGTIEVFRPGKIVDAAFASEANLPPRLRSTHSAPSIDRAH
jgi:spectinomycin phosphotransferase